MTARGGRSSNRPAAGVPGVTRGYRYNELIGTQGGLTALHFAARQGSAAAARALVDGGADVNVSSPGDQATPLLVAVINGHFDLAAMLLEKGASPNLTSDAGVSPLYAALNVQWAPIAAYPQPRSHLQQTRTYLDVMQLLLDRGADPNARVRRKVWYSGYNFDQSGVDEAGATPLWRAAYAADVPAMKLLVAHGADPAIPTMKMFSRRGPEDPVAGADKSGLPPLPIGGPGATPLHAAAGPGYAMGFAGNSHHVAPTGMLPAVKYLVEELGADVNAVDHDGNSVVHNAASRGDTEMVRYLVVEGRGREEDQSLGPDDDRRGERTGAAHAALSRDHQAAREPRRDEQPQVRVVLTISASPRLPAPTARIDQRLSGNDGGLAARRHVGADSSGRAGAGADGRARAAARDGANARANAGGDAGALGITALRALGVHHVALRLDGDRVAAGTGDRSRRHRQAGRPFDAPALDRPTPPRRSPARRLWRASCRRRRGPFRAPSRTPNRP